MKKLFAAVSLLLLAVFFATPEIKAQSADAGTGGWVCPGYGQGRMMRQFGKGCPRWQCAGMNQGDPLTQEQAGKLLENYVLRSGFANLKAGEMVDAGDVYKATVVTKDGSLVEELEINKKTGLFRRASN